MPYIFQVLLAAVASEHDVERPLPSRFADLGLDTCCWRG